MTNFQASSIKYNSTIDLPSRNSVRSRIAETNDFVREKGVPIIWEKAILCPCSMKPGYSDPICPICGGQGITYVDPIDTVALFTNLEGVPNFMEPGLWIFGLGNISTPCDIKLSNRDRITLPDYPTYYIELLNKRGALVRTRFNIIDIEFLCYRKNKRELVYLVENTDFNYTDNTIRFLTDIPDVELSIRYQYYLQYIVMTFLHEARGMTDNSEIVQLPNQYLVRRCDMVQEDKRRSLAGSLQ